MFTIRFTAIDDADKPVRFNVREPISESASKYAYDRALKIADQQGWTCLQFAS